jgi:hypothetical protein
MGSALTAGYPRIQTCVRPAWFNGAPEIEIKSDSLRTVDTLSALLLFCGSGLAREKLKGAAFILISRVIVNDHRGQARSHRGGRARSSDQVGSKAASLCF